MQRRGSRGARSQLRSSQLDIGAGVLHAQDGGNGIVGTNGFARFDQNLTADPRRFVSPIVRAQLTEALDALARQAWCRATGGITRDTMTVRR